MRGRIRHGLLWAGLAVTALGPAAPGAGRAGGPEAGASIYHHGVGRAPITAGIAGGRVQVGGAQFPCVSCHKRDGLGVQEGGLKPRNVTWRALTAPVMAGGRGYDAATLARAIAEGRDAQGNALGPGMPRYAMEPADLDALIAYLRGFDQAAIPGVSGETIRIASALPLHGRSADVARSVERLLDLAVLDINTRRRFEGRRIVRVSVPFDPDVPGDALRAVQEAVASDPPLAFLSNLAIGPDSPAHAFLAASGIPEIAPLAAPLRSDDRSAVWIEPSVAEQARALVREAARAPAMRYAGAIRSRPLRLGILADADAASRVAGDAARDEAERGGAVILAMPSRRPDAVAALQRAEVDAVLLFASAAEAAELLETAQHSGWRPVLLGRREQLGALERDRQAQARGTIFLLTSYGGVEPRSRGAVDFRRVVGELGGGHPELLRDVYVGAKLLEAVLASSGRSLSRAGMLATISDVRGFVTGVMPPLSFGPDASRIEAARLMWLDPTRARLVPLPAEPPP